MKNDHFLCRVNLKQPFRFLRLEVMISWNLPFYIRITNTGLENGQFGGCLYRGWSCLPFPYYLSSPLGFLLGSKLFIVYICVFSFTSECVMFRFGRVSRLSPLVYPFASSSLLNNRGFLDFVPFLYVLSFS